MLMRGDIFAVSRCGGSGRSSLRTASCCWGVTGDAAGLRRMPTYDDNPLGDGRGVVRLMRRVGWTRRRRALVERSHDGWKEE
jgi:hypothetical protein